MISDVFKKLVIRSAFVCTLPKDDTPPHISVYPLGSKLPIPPIASETRPAVSQLASWSSARVRAVLQGETSA